MTMFPGLAILIAGLLGVALVSFTIVGDDDDQNVSL
jgi:hypothetical protein